MEKWAHSLYMKNIRETIDAYNLIEPGDKILVGLSGGKDSGLLFKALHDLSRYGIYDFEVKALTVNHGMMAGLNDLTQWCEVEGMAHLVYEEAFIERLEKSEQEGFSACYTCARMRKGILKKMAVAEGFNKIAFGHTRDDLIETLLMNVMDQGRLAAIPAKTTDAESDLQIIRPLIRLDEKSIVVAGRNHGIPIVASNCKFAENKKRATADQRLDQVEKILPGFSEQLTRALQNRDDDRLL